MEEENRRLEVVRENSNDHCSTQRSGISALRVGEVDRLAEADVRTRESMSRRSRAWRGS